MSNASYYDHFLSWYNRRNDPDVLFLFFEDLKEDLRGQVGHFHPLVLKGVQWCTAHV